MIKKSLKLLLFVFICAVAVIILRFDCENPNAIDVMPKVVGSASTDSVRINFGTIDTTYYPAVLDADSLIILIYPPDNAAPESTADGGTGVFNLTTGYYQYHRRGSNATPDLGVYTVCVKAWRGSAVRGIGTCSYLVTGAGTYHYGVQDSIRDLAIAIRDTTDAILDTLQLWDDDIALLVAMRDSIDAILDTLQNQDNWVGTSAKQTLVIDTVNAILDTIQDHAPHGDDWGQGGGNLAAITDTVNALLDTLQAGFGSRTVLLNNEVDSLLAVLYDRTNDSNFVRLIAHLLLHDSVTIDKSNAWGLRSGLSTLTTSDNIGINWGDVDNKSTYVYLDGTIIATAEKAYLDPGELPKIEAECEDALADYGASTFDPSSDNVAVVDSVTGVARVDSVRYVDTVGTVISSAPTGWGAYTVTLYLLNDADSTAVKGVIINIYDSTSGEWQGGHVTPANGIRQFSLNASTYTIHLQDPPNAITSPEYMTISADTTDTFWVETFDPGTPPSGDKCRVWCIVPDLEGDWEENCELTIYGASKYEPVLLDASPVNLAGVTATSNDTGYVYLDVFRSASLTSDAGDVEMWIEIRNPLGDLITDPILEEIPDAASWEIEW